MGVSELGGMGRQGIKAGRKGWLFYRLNDGALWQGGRVTRLDIGQYWGWHSKESLCQSDMGSRSGQLTRRAALEDGGRVSLVGRKYKVA